MDPGGSEQTKGPESSPDGVRLYRVDEERHLSAFLDVPGEVYRHDPAWIPPLRLERRLHLSRRNPYFRHGRWQAWVAFRQGRPVGRISAQVDARVRRLHGEDLGHFGFLEAVDDPAVFQRLLGAAEEWLRARGTARIQGPFNFSINQECGLLVEGFEHPPMIMMAHGRPHYGPRLEELGYEPVRDLLAYRIRGDFDHPPPMRRLVERYRDRIRVRPLRGDRLDEELELMRGVFNDAWAENWGFVPFSEAEFADLGKQLHLFVDDELVRIAELDGEAAAFIVALPNLNEAIRDLEGRLLPLGWAKLLWRLYGGRIRSARIPLVGVRRRHQRSPLGAALALSLVASLQEPGLERGIRDVELSWILEENVGMRSILDILGARPYKRYRIFEKALPGAPGGAS